MDLELDRRRLLLSSIGAVALAGVPGLASRASATSSASAATSTAAAGWIQRKNLGRVGWGIRETTNEFNGYGMHIHRSYPQFWTFDADFYQLASQWARALNDMCWRHTRKPRFTVDWFGCRYTLRRFEGDHDSQHWNARAMDLTAVYFTDGQFVDMNMSWLPQAPLALRRRYIAVAALLRVYFLEVLTAPYLGHYDHIHLDPTQPPTPGLASTPRDTYIVQRACNELNNANIALDGDWGPQTEGAYQNLLAAFGMQCVDPKASYLEMAAFLQMICRHGVRNRAAGWYQGDC